MTDLQHAAWRTSTHSADQGSCAEVAPLADGVAVRHGHHPAGTTIVATPAEWHALLDGVRATPEPPHRLRAPRLSLLAA